MCLQLGFKALHLLAFLQITPKTGIVILMLSQFPHLCVFATPLFSPPASPSPPPALWTAGIHSLISGISQAQPLLGRR